MGKKLHSWKITYMTDYPYSDYVIIVAPNEEEAWDEFERRGLGMRNEYSEIEKM